MTTFICSLASLGSVLCSKKTAKFRLFLNFALFITITLPFEHIYLYDLKFLNGTESAALTSPFIDVVPAPMTHFCRPSKAQRGFGLMTTFISSWASFGSVLCCKKTAIFCSFLSYNLHYSVELFCPLIIQIIITT